MMDVIDLNERRNAKSAPEPDCVFVAVEDGKPVKYFKFSGSYEFADKGWIVHIWATDQQQAEAKMTALAGVKYDGQIFAEIPA